MNRARRILGYAMFLVLFTVLAAHAQDELACDTWDNVTAALAKGYGEARRAYGLDQTSNRVLTLFASDTTGSWTLTRSTPDGWTCLVAAGVGFTALPPPREGDPL